MSKSKSDEFRVYPRFTEEDYERIKYWASHEGLSTSQFVVEATLHYIDEMNGNYDLPKLEIQRLNQLVDTVSALTVATSALVDVCSNGFGTMERLATGEMDYLSE